MSCTAAPKVPIGTDDSTLFELLRWHPKLERIIRILNNQRTGAYRVMRDVENLSDIAFNAIEARGNTLEPVADAIVQAGFAVRRDAGGIMQALSLSREQLHDVMCGCESNKDVLRPAQIAEMLRAVQQSELPAR